MTALDSIDSTNSGEAAFAARALLRNALEQRGVLREERCSHSHYHYAFIMNLCVLYGVPSTEEPNATELSGSRT